MGNCHRFLVITVRVSSSKFKLPCAWWWSLCPFVHTPAEQNTKIDAIGHYSTDSGTVCFPFVTGKYDLWHMSWNNINNRNKNSASNTIHPNCHFLGRRAIKYKMANTAIKLTTKFKIGSENSFAWWDSVRLTLWKSALVYWLHFFPLFSLYIEGI